MEKPAIAKTKTPHPKTRTHRKQPLGKLEVAIGKAAGKHRKNIDAAGYKHIVLGLIFLKYISDAFEDLHGKLLAA